MRLNITKQDRRNLKKVLSNFKRPKSYEEIFYDLCFCITAPQTTFKNNKKVINWLIDNKFVDVHYFIKEKMFISGWNTYCPDLMYTYKDFLKALKPTRFYKQKAKYLMELKKNYNEIIHVIKLYLLKAKTEELRDWLVNNVRGLGMKTASHFLRNLGDTELAIIDVHIIKFLNEYVTKDNFLKDTSHPDISTKSNYLYWEKKFQEIAKKYKLTTAELDALIWKRYSRTDWEDFKY